MIEIYYIALCLVHFWKGLLAILLFFIFLFIKTITQFIFYLFLFIFNHMPHALPQPRGDPLGERVGARRWRRGGPNGLERPRGNRQHRHLPDLHSTDAGRLRFARQGLEGY